MLGGKVPLNTSLVRIYTKFYKEIVKDGIC